MELTQVQSEVPLLQPPAPRSNFTCFHWLSVCSFVLILVATTAFALLHFQIIPMPGNQPAEEYEVPQVLHLRTFLDSKHDTQTKDGKRLAAHLIGKVKNNQIQWEFNQRNTFKSDELTLTKNTLKIPKDGLYFVYTQVVYTGNDCKEIISKELTHTINRKSEDLEKALPLLTSTKTACEGKSSGVWYQPIYQGGLFRLEEGDILSTQTTHIHLLNENKGQVYFGVLAL